MADLKTEYMGLQLDCPIVVGSSGLTKTVAGIRRCADAGAGAVVVKSLFEEQIRMEYEAVADSMDAYAHPEALGYLQADSAMEYGPRDYLSLLEGAAKAVSIPVIASVNCVSPEHWIGFAGKIEAAGAAALELNVYVMGLDPSVTSGEIEKLYLDTVRAVRSKVKIPVAVKLVPYLTNMSRMVTEMEQAGVDAMVLFNRFFHPDVDLETMGLRGGLSLSHPDEYRLPLRWVGLMFGRVGLDFCASSGIHDADAVVKMLLAGAAAVQVTSALYKRGVEHIGVLRTGLNSWMEGHDMPDIRSFRGRASRFHTESPELFERAQYIKAFVDAE